MKESRDPGKAGTPDLEALSLADLAKDLLAGGEEAFRQKYPHPFLLVEDRPPGQSDWIDFSTMESCSHETPSPKRPYQGKLVVPLAKSQRNVFDSKITVGRAKNNDIVVRSPKVSKLHASFLIQKDQSLLLQDMGSVNGTVVNDRRLEKGQTVTLKNGDRIVFWRYQFTFMENQALIQLLLTKI